VKEIDYKNLGSIPTNDRNLHPEAGALVTPIRDRN
jgi:hypothetical protein